MSLVSLSLATKVAVGIGVVGLATYIPLSTLNKGEKQTIGRQEQSVAPERGSSSTVTTNNPIKTEALKKLQQGNCYTANLNNKETQLGDFYICPSKLIGDGQREGASDSLEGVWYLDDKTITEKADNIGDVSEILKKVTSIKYHEKAETESEHITFRLEAEREDRKIYVDSSKSWNYSDVPTSFSDIEFSLSEYFTPSR